ncbi:DUF308 domain-containing protein [Saccharopolyspora sp. SCSIO 74807]|uniref:DUF308 domain-containing protein n=2 Tax=unclassified Saccharopolyspora TaxID=2646250 RepID=UPI0030CE7013
MSTRHDNADGPEDIDAAFAEIVAGLERDEPLARWPQEDGPRTTADDADGQGRAPDPPGRADEALSPAPVEPAGPRDWTPPAEADDEGHYEPPEPPPMPRPTAATIGGISTIVLGVLLLVVPGLAGLGGSVALPAGLIAISGGIGWLLLRLRSNPPGSGDDGARL